MLPFLPILGGGAYLSPQRRLKKLSMTIAYSFFPPTVSATIPIAGGPSAGQLPFTPRFTPATPFTNSIVLNVRNPDR